MEKTLDQIANYVRKSKIDINYKDSIEAVFRGLIEANEAGDNELFKLLLNCTNIAIPVMKKDKLLYGLYVKFIKEI